MAEALSTVKKTSRKTKQDVLASKSFLHCGTPLGSVNANRLSLMSNARLQKITSKSLEKLSVVCEKEESEDLDGYFFDYGSYLLRKAQNRILAENKEQKEDNVKLCFVSLKLEFEGLLNKFIALSKETQYFKIYFEIISECSQKVEEGKKFLKVLKESEFESLLTSLSDSLDHTINKLQLVDIDKSLIEELFNKNIWGSGSELEECLKKINTIISKNEKEVSNIAKELVEIKQLCLENTLLRERFASVFEKVSADYLEANYKLFTSIVKTAFKKRQECEDDFTSHSLDCDLSEFVQSVIKPRSERLTLQLSKFDCSYSVEPNSASTPHQN